MKTFDEVWPTVPPGWLTEAEARLLWRAASETEGDILEVGCYRGRSTVLLAGLGRPMHCVDPFSGFDSDDPDGSKTRRAFVRGLEERGLTFTDVLNYKPEEYGLPPGIDWERHGVLGSGWQVALWPQRVEDWEPRPCGFAYLDGDHSFEGTRRQIAKARACGVAALAIHDIADEGGGRRVRDAALRALGAPHELVETLGVWRFL